MSEHVHLEQTKVRENHVDVVRTVVRRKYADKEIRIARDLGYQVETRYCGDRACLGDEPETGQFGKRR